MPLQPLVLSGRAIYAWYVALADALGGGSTGKVDNPRIWKLYEAGMTANIRLRFTTSHADAHVWSETIRASHMSGRFTRGDAERHIGREDLAQLGIQYKCKPVNKNIVMGLLALIPIVNDDGSVTRKTSGVFGEEFDRSLTIEA